MKIVGLCGLAGSGKDAAADVLVSEFRFVKIALADPLKRIVKNVYDFSDDQLWGPSQRRNEPDTRYPRPWPQDFLTPREALQSLGSEWGRKCYPNTWIDLTIRTAQKLLNKPDEGYCYNQQKGLYSIFEEDFEPAQPHGVVVPDVRFMNELLAIKAAGGRTYRIVRPGSGLSGERGQHESETEQAGIPDHYFDGVVMNRSTLDGLQATVRELAKDLQWNFHLDEKRS